MSTTLVSFLGRSPKRDNQYRRTRYTFGDHTTWEGAFFGYGLRQKLTPDHLVVLGTSGSMWDHLFDQDLVLEAQLDEQRIELMTAVEAKSVNQAMLDVLAPALGEALHCKVTLLVVPYGHAAEEQTGIVNTVSRVCDDGDVLHLDITHCFRHLPMLAMMGMLHVRATRPTVQLGGIWYGSFDEDTQAAPVYDLSGLLSLADWAECLNRYDQSGDHGIFSKLLPTDIGQLLSEAAFHERTQNPGQARSKLKEARRKLEAQPLRGLAALYSSDLLERISWVDEDRLYQRQRSIAEQAVKRGDELRAALMGFEAFITRLMDQRKIPGADPSKHDDRKLAKEAYEADKSRQRSARIEWENYMLLRDIRNQLAHGISSPRAEVQKSMSSSKTLKSELDRLLAALLPDL